MIIQPRAKVDLKEISSYLDQHSVEAADRFLNRVERTFDLLSRFPGVGTRLEGRVRRTKGLRRFYIIDFDRYVIYYRFEDTLAIVRVLHSARDRDTILKDEL